MDPSRNQKFDGGRYQGSHGGHWDRSEEKVTKTHRDRTMGTARYSVADEMVTLVEKMETTMEVDVREGGMVTTPPPPPPSNVLSTPTYLLPGSSDRRPAFSARLVGGGVY